MLTANFLFLGFSSQPSKAQSAFDDPASRTATGGGDLVAVSEQLDAGNITLGSSSQTVLLFRNDGTRPIETGNISLYPSSNVSAAVGDNECSVAPLPPGAVCAISLSVKGLQPGKFRVEMLMRHGGKTKLVTTAITGTVERSEDATFDVINDLETIPSELSFGDLKESRPLTRSVVMRNVTSQEVGIQDIFIESNSQAGYTLRSDCESLLSGEACIATVTWAPQQRGPSTGVLVVEHDGPTGVVSVILDGTYEPDEAEEVGIFPEAVPGKGLLTASKSEINFGTDIESTSAITVSLVNVGDENIVLDDISLANEDSGLEVVENGCKPGLALSPVEACPLTIRWNPVRTGSILDDVQITHDGARGILVLPIRGAASQTVNKNTQPIVLSDSTVSIPTISSSELGEVAPQPVQQRKQPIQRPQVQGSLEGYKITSLGQNRAIVAGPGGSRVVFDGQETVIGAVLWQVNVRNSAVEFVNDQQRILLLFDRSLSSLGGSSSNNSSRNTNNSNNDSDSNETAVN
ncbi:MAG: hypothetical protein AAF549_04235 [Pseudomonadota bacterium]